MKAENNKRIYTIFSTANPLYEIDVYLVDNDIIAIVEDPMGNIITVESDNKTREQAIKKAEKWIKQNL